MKTISVPEGVLGLALLLLLSPVLWAQEEEPPRNSREQPERDSASEEKQSDRSERPRIVLGKPSARRGAPVRSVGGGSRGVTGDWPYLYVLAPPEVGLTTQEQPSLFWYLSQPTARSFLLTLSELKELPETVLEVRIRELSGQGIFRMDLSSMSVRLKGGVDYMWTIALEVDPESPSKNITSSTIIRREPSPALDPVVEPAGRGAWQDPEKGLELARDYAGGGYFLDALAILSNLVEAHPDDQELRDLRIDLIRQTELNLDEGS